MNRTQVKLDQSDVARWSELTVPYLLERDGLATDKTGLVFEGTSRTYGELRDRYRRLANALVDLGIQPMDRVAVLTQNRLEFIEVEVGIAGAGAIMVPLNWRLQQEEVSNLLKRSEARAVIVENDYLGMIHDLRDSGEVPDLETVIALPDGGADYSYEELSAAASPERPRHRGRLEDPHEIIYTSGTTGEPKGAVWSNGTLIWNSIEQVMDYKLTPDSSTYAVIDLYYIGGRHDFTWPVLHAGGTVHVKRSGGWDPSEVARYVADNKITHVLWVPMMLFDILRLPELGELGFSNLRMIMCGGAPISAAVTERAQAAFPQTDFIQVFGLTEGGGTVTFIPPEYAKEKAGSAGRASMHNEIRIIDEEGKPSAPNETGEILVKGPAVMAGYWDAPDMTASTVIDGWLHTGDMGYFDEDGFMFIAGRKKDMIISGGMNIFPAEIEDVLREHPDVVDAAVIGVPDERWGEKVCAVIEAAEGAQIVEDEVIAFCKDRIASYRKPSYVRVVDEIPRTASGKARKPELRDRFVDIGNEE